MTSTYNTGKKELIFTTVNELYDVIGNRPKKNYKIIGLFKELTEEQCRDLVFAKESQSIQAAKLELYHIIKSQGLDPEKTLIIEKI